MSAPSKPFSFSTHFNLDFHTELNKKHGCNAEYLNSGYHLRFVVNGTLPNCTSQQVLQVCWKKFTAYSYAHNKLIVCPFMK